MSFEVDLHAAEALPQPVEFEVKSFLHGLNKQRHWLRKQQKSSTLVGTGEPDTCLPFDDSNSIDFQKQLDKIALWFEKWTHLQRCLILERLVSIGDYSQFQLLWTAIQPVLHKDFIYTAKDRYPTEKFIPVSTEKSRAARERLSKNRLIQKYYRVKSAYVHDEEEVRQHAGLLPPLPAGTSRPSVFQTLNDTYLRLPSLHRRQSITNPTDHLQPSYEDPTANWRRPMQVRRHLQTEIEEPNNKSQFPPHSEILFYWYSLWDGPKRAGFLQLALMKLDARQLYFLSSYLSVRRHRDIIAHLPSHISHHILSYLSPEDLTNCSKVSTTWRKLCQHNVVWRKKCRETLLEVRPISTPRIGGWKSAYRKDRVLKVNWKRGRYTRTELIGHTDSVLCVAMSKKILVSGGKDSTVRVWNLVNGRNMHVFTGHQKGIWAVAIVSDHLVASGSYDRTVKIWGIGAAKVGCFRTFYGHMGPIWTMVCKNKFLASGSQDRLIKVWDIRHCRVERTLQGHTSAVFSIDADDHMSKLYSGSADRSIRVWNLTNGSCVRVIWTDEATSIMAVSFSHGLLACTSGGHVTVWDPDKGSKVRSFKAHKQRIETIKLRMNDATATSGVIMTGGKDGRLKYWNVFGETKVNKLDGHRGQINALCADSLRIITASYDKTINVWDFREKRSLSQMSSRSKAVE